MRNAAIGVEEFYEFDADRPPNPKPSSLTSRLDGGNIGDGMELRVGGQSADSGGDEFHRVELDGNAVGSRTLSLVR